MIAAAEARRISIAEFDLASWVGRDDLNVTLAAGAGGSTTGTVAAGVALSDGLGRGGRSLPRTGALSGVLLPGVLLGATIVV
jgi:hypothetical protein